LPSREELFSGRIYHNLMVQCLMEEYTGFLRETLRNQLHDKDEIKLIYLYELMM